MKVRPGKDATGTSTPTINTILSTTAVSRKHLSRTGSLSGTFPNLSQPNVQISLRSKLFPSSAKFTPLQSGPLNTGSQAKRPMDRCIRLNLPSSLSVQEKPSVKYLPFSTYSRHSDFTDAADSLIFTCRSHIALRSRRHISQDLDKQKDLIKSSVQSIMDLGTGKFRKYNAGRKEFWQEEQFYTRDQVRKMLSNVRQQLKRVRHGVV